MTSQNHDDMLVEFKQWLEKNSKRFKNKPILCEEREECLELMFENVASELRFTICQNGTAVIFVTYQDEFWEVLAEFDIWERRTSSGEYYCDGCITKEFFPSREELWENHIFEAFLKWVNEEIIPLSWLCIFGESGSTWATIKAEENMESVRPNEHLLKALPVLQTRSST